MHTGHLKNWIDIKLLCYYMQVVLEPWRHEDIETQDKNVLRSYICVSVHLCLVPRPVGAEIASLEFIAYSAESSGR